MRFGYRIILGNLCNSNKLAITSKSSHRSEAQKEMIIGLFTVAILGAFSAHFQTHFRLIFMYLAEKQIKVTENDVENDAKNGYREHPGKEILEKWSKNAFFLSGTVPKR